MASVNDRIGIGFIGAGGIARQRHLPGLQEVAGVEFVAVANRRRQTAEKVAADYGFKRVVDDWRAILEMPDVDAVFIAAPPYLHAVATIAALDAGKHVFCQARMARNYAEAKQMYDRSRQTKLVTMLCPPPHAMRGDYLVKKLIKDGYLGRLLELQVYNLLDSFVDPEAPLHWRQDFEVSGYNTLHLGMLVEVMHRWFGYANRVAAQAAIHTEKRRHPETGEIVPVKIADSLGVTARLENGALAVMHFSGTTRFAEESHFQMFGSEGTLYYYVNSHRILGARAGDKELQPIEIPSDLVREWRAEADFIDAIRLGTPVSPDFTEGLKYMEFTEAVYRSANTGRAVDLPLAD